MRNNLINIRIPTGAIHHENTSVQCTPPYTPLLNNKTGVYRGIHFFLIFALKHRMWVQIMGTHNLCFEQKEEKYQIFSIEIYHFYSRKILQYIVWACCRNAGQVLQCYLLSLQQLDVFVYCIANLSRVMRKPTFWFPTWSDTNQTVQLQKKSSGFPTRSHTNWAVQSQKMTRGLKFRI